MTLDIMMPFYGRIDHFKLAVQSVLDQTSPDWRLVIVDDVYPDLSAGEWARSIADSRVTYIRNEINLRPSRNYRKCVSLMQTEFAVLMGCDDRLRPRYVARMHELIQQYPGASIIQPGVQVIDGDGRATHPIADRVKEWCKPRHRGAASLVGSSLAASLMRGNWTYFPSLCWRVDKIRDPGFRVDLDVVQDLAMITDIVATGGSLVVDDEVVFEYRRHRASYSAITGPDGSKFKQERVVFRESASRFHALGWRNAEQAARAHLTSRLNAATELPAALRARDLHSLRVLGRHIAGGTGRGGSGSTIP